MDSFELNMYRNLGRFPLKSVIVSDADIAVKDNLNEALNDGAAQLFCAAARVFYNKEISAEAALDATYSLPGFEPIRSPYRQVIAAEYVYLRFLGIAIQFADDLEGVHFPVYPVSADGLYDCLPGAIEALDEENSLAEEDAWCEARAEIMMGVGFKVAEILGANIPDDSVDVEEMVCEMGRELRDYAMCGAWMTIKAQ